MTPIPLIDLAAQQARLKPAIDANIARVLAHGQYIQGPEVAAFEAKLAAFAGCRHAVSCGNGTDALTMALMAVEVGPGAAVFLPSFTFTATAEVVALLGARPVFVDVDPDDFTIDPADLERQVAAVKREGRETPTAVIAVDLFGQPAAYAALHETAQRHGMWVLGDAAQSFGGAQNGVRVGALARMTALSFFPSKPLACYGDGGAVLTDDDSLAQVLRSIGAHGRGPAKYDIVRIGLNSRLDTLQAAILLAKIEAFEGELAARARIAEQYDRRLGNLVRTPVIRPGNRSAWAHYCIRVPDRDRVAAHLSAQKIANAVYYPRPVHLQSAYARYGNGEKSLPASEALCGEILALPLYPDLDADAVDRVCDAIAAALG
ncbi:MAG: DegT/DnrJ/EryC1/StrS family aminotransferase [Alphaproteobacteria bacterium]